MNAITDNLTPDDLSARLADVIYGDVAKAVPRAEKVARAWHHEQLTGRKTWAVLQQVDEERHRQEVKWGTVAERGPKMHATLWFAILGEEVGEVARAQLERNPANYREELIQVAAVAVAMVEALDLNGGVIDR